MIKDNFLKEIKISDELIEQIEDKQKREKRLIRLLKYGCGFITLLIIYLLIDVIRR